MGGQDTSVVIIGTGFSGLGMAIQLKQAGRHDFVILEKAQDVGGTWRDNTYPGCACDIPSHLYSFSYEQNPEWSRLYAGQREIWDYLRICADKHNLREHIRFGVKVTGAVFDDDSKRWTVRTEGGDTYTADAMVAGIGALHIPSVPDLPGMERFQGESFHSAEWNHDYDLTGKRVAVIGTGASAIQFVPEIAKQVDKLTLFQRTPAWVMPKADRPVSKVEKTLFRNLPATQWLRRTALFWALDSRALAFTFNPKLMKFASKPVRKQIKEQVHDPELRRKLTPDYTMGCKRVLISNDYYPTFNRPNVDLVTEGVTEVREHSVVTADGAEHEVDAIIFGTGFHVTDAFDYLDIKGRNGVDLTSQWREKGLETYLGIGVAGFPNLFFLLGPNTGLGHNSVVLMIEAQARYVLQCLGLLATHDVAAMDVRPAPQRRFNLEIQRKLRKGVWSVGGCTSWYLDSAGVNRTVWPGFVWQYVLRTRKVELADYELLAATRAATSVG
jgi:cation diffusion facilitator CzcD-associated flavoprotein CzcO